MAIAGDRQNATKSRAALIAFRINFRKLPQ
jgi:hypothetical protein